MDDNVFGCFVSSTIGDPMGPEFRSYIYGENGLKETLSPLKYSDYGDDLKLILFQFYVNPIPYLVENLKEIENYRKKEKAIGIPIIINNENFFSKTEGERYDFLRENLLLKLETLSLVINQKKLDTNIESLKSDLKKILVKLM